MPGLLDVCVTIICLSLSSVLYRRRCTKQWDSDSLGRGYILQNQVTHARFLPVEASNSFTYPTLSLLLSLNAVETGKLDLQGGWVFGYGGTFGRVMGLRAKGYLTDGGPKDNRTIKQKLVDVLESRGYLKGEEVLEDVWIMTMPSFMGFESINPLTAYFCYKPGGVFWAVVLEIHNTFGESHIHILETGKGEDPKPDRGYDDQWTFLREFHVSPFNDRSGYYKISVRAPSHPPSPPNNTLTRIAPPRPTIRVHYHIALPAPSSSDGTEIGPLKLTAILRPTKSLPLTTANVGTGLLRTPLALFLSMPRILYQAWVLHYKKRLDVYLRPDPHPAPGIPFKADVNEEQGKEKDAKIPGGVKWLTEGLLERLARIRAERFLERRTSELSCVVTLVPADPSVQSRSFPVLPSEDADVDTGKPREELKIYYTSPRFFTIVLMCPSPYLALLLGSDTEGVFRPSSREAFLKLFGNDRSSTPGSNLESSGSSLPQRLRSRPIPASLLTSPSTPIPRIHPLDSPTSSIMGWLADVSLVSAFLLLDRFEYWIFRIARARIVNGGEPWLVWNRAEEISKSGTRERRAGVKTGVGSVLRTL